MHDIDFEYVGLVTQLSANRLPRLERTVKRWNGPISAALFLDSNVRAQDQKLTVELVVDYFDAD
jgi:hypothetical protein